MAAKYFKKFMPSTPAFIVLDKPEAITFDTLDHVLGWYATTDERVQNEFLRLIREQRGGITEVSQQEYESEYSQKKMTGEQAPISPWREELSRSAGLGLVNREVVGRLGGGNQGVAPVKGKSDIRRGMITMEESAPAPEPTNHAKAPEQPEFKATLGQRKQPTNAKGKDKNSPSAKD